MMRRCLVLGLMLAVVAPVSARAQGGGGGNPFGPLPQEAPAPPEQPEPQKIESNNGDDDGLGGTAFWLIMGTTGLLFVAVGFYITRDMRRTTASGRKPKRRLRGSGRPAADAADALAVKHRTGSQRAKAKAQQRAKTKAARKQRRSTRSR